MPKRSPLAERIQAPFDSTSLVVRRPILGRRRPPKRWVKYFSLTVGGLVVPGMLAMLAMESGLASGGAMHQRPLAL